MCVLHTFQPLDLCLDWNDSLKGQHAQLKTGSCQGLYEELHSVIERELIVKSSHTVVIKEGWLLPVGHLGRLRERLRGLWLNWRAGPGWERERQALLTSLTTVTHHAGWHQLWVETKAQKQRFWLVLPFPDPATQCLKYCILYVLPTGQEFICDSLGSDIWHLQVRSVFT